MFTGVGLKLGYTATDIFRVNVYVWRVQTVEEPPAIIFVDRPPPVVIDASVPNVQLLLACLDGSTSTTQ